MCTAGSSYLQCTSIVFYFFYFPCSSHLCYLFLVILFCALSIHLYVYKVELCSTMCLHSLIHNFKFLCVVVVACNFIHYLGDRKQCNLIPRSSPSTILFCHYKMKQNIMFTIRVEKLKQKFKHKFSVFYASFLTNMQQGVVVVDVVVVWYT